MGQLGVFDADKRLKALSARGDPLEAIDHLVSRESFRAEIEVALEAERHGRASAGRLQRPRLKRQGHFKQIFGVL